MAAYTNLGGLGGLGGVEPPQKKSFLQTPEFGNVLSALGVSLMGSNSNTPFAAFGPALMSMNNGLREQRKEQGQTAAMEQALISAGMDPEQARVMSANPSAAKFTLEQQAAQREQESAAAQRGQTYEFFKQRDPELAAMMDAGLPARDAFEIYTKKVQGGGEDDYTKRAQAAQNFGMSPDDPGYQSFILTGKMPREDAQPLTATDKKAILEADEMVQANQTAVDMLSSVIEPDASGKSLNDKASYGFGADSQSWLARNDPTGFFDDEKGQATTELSNVVLNQALSTLKSTFGAAPTEGERKILVDLQASVDKTPTERKAILKRAIDLANRRLSFNKQRADELRGGTFYQQGGGAGGNPSAPPANPAARRTSSGVEFSIEGQ